MKRVNRVFSLRLLLLLGGAVLLVHLALLHGTSLTLSLPQTAPSRAFSTRAIEAIERPATRVPPAQPAPRPEPPPPIQSKPAPPTLAELESPVSAAAETASEDAEQAEPEDLAEETSSDPPPDPPAQDEAAAEEDPPQAAPRPPSERPVVLSAYKVPASVRLKYEVKGNRFPYRLDAEMVWQQDGKSYDARLVFSAGFLPVLVQTSRGQITPEGLAPLRYSEKKRSEVAAHFIREQGKVTFSANTPDLPLLAGAQDRLSILVQLAAMITGDPGRFPAATTITLQTVGPRDADTWLFTVEKEEALPLPEGEQATLKLMRNPRREFDQTVELWLAPALGYLPVRIKITESNGDFMDQKWLASEHRQ